MPGCFVSDITSVGEGITCREQFCWELRGSSCLHSFTKGSGKTLEQTVGSAFGAGLFSANTPEGNFPRTAACLSGLSLLELMMPKASGGRQSHVQAALLQGFHTLAPRRRQQENDRQAPHSTHTIKQHVDVKMLVYSSYCARLFSQCC